MNFIKQKTESTLQNYPFRDKRLFDNFIVLESKAKEAVHKMAQKISAVQMDEKAMLVIIVSKD